jgi:rod shape determining protein RodA
VKKIDWILVVSLCGLVTIGSLSIYSASYNWTPPLWKKQIIWIILGLLGLIAASFIDPHTLKRNSLFIYISSLLLLIVVLFMPPIRNVSSWFTIGGISIQPSELAKLALIIMLASYLCDKDEAGSWSSLILPTCIICSLPILLILCQPDVGTSLSFICLFFVMLYFTGIEKISFLFLLILAGVGVIGLLFFSLLKFEYDISLSFVLISLGAIITLLFIIFASIAYFSKNKKVWLLFIASILSLFLSLSCSFLLKPYQEKRLIVFLKPSIDPLDAGYNIIQSKIAIGGGGLKGMGFLKGTQSHLGFLPERTTDFIFSVWAEEFGFVGSILLLFFYGLLIFRGLEIAERAPDRFSRFLGIGISTMIAISVFINIGITLGILPATGIPLPFVSYGGSSLLTNMVGVGLVLAIKKKSLTPIFIQIYYP